MSKIRILKVSVIIALIISLLVSMVQFEAGCQELKANVFRLHIIANSDSAEDQALKLMVRDALLKKGCSVFNNSENLDTAIYLAENSINDFESVAREVIKKEGYSYSVTADVEKTYFDTRVYDEFTLPAGEYYALTIKIGEAKGRNWWCVMYPAICLPAATSRLENSVSNGAANIANNANKFVIKFKTVEIFEEIKNFFKKR